MYVEDNLLGPLGNLSQFKNTFILTDLSLHGFVF